jgi:DNA-directed RNA polymerase specialized sigma24 family protein
MGFHTTHWTMIVADSAEAYEALAATYWYPLYAFVRRQGSTAHDAEDLTQEFFRRFLEKHALTHMRPAAGKFRSFLLVCLKNFLANERERSRAQRRGGGQLMISLDGTEAETRYSAEPMDRLTPETLFDRRWAWAVLERTMRGLEREYAGNDKMAQFSELQGFLPGGGENLSRAKLAAKRGVSVAAIDVAIHRLRQRFGALLREQVAQTVASEAEVEEELRYLISVVGR